MEDRVGENQGAGQAADGFQHSTETVVLNRQKAPWPKDEAEADKLWHDRIVNELLQEKLSEHPIEPGPKLVERRYDRMLRNIHEEDTEEQVKLFLDALAQAYDPHSEYLSAVRPEEFQHQHGPLARRHRRDAAERRRLRQDREPGRRAVRRRPAGA